VTHWLSHVLNTKETAFIFGNFDTFSKIAVPEARTAFYQIQERKE